ncbi:MAG TPA: GTPase [Pirellulales bacterium]
MNAPIQVCVLTPSARGAVATIALAGPSASALIERCVQSARQGERPGALQAPSIAAAAVGQIRLGVWGSGSGEQVVVCRQSPDRYEIHCHGGAAAIETIVSSLVAAGAKRIDWREWVAVEAPGKIAAAALVALASARTGRTAAILLDQYRGALSDELRAARDEIARGDLTTAKERLRTLIARSRVGRHLIEPFRVILAGLPNVGKSSLINALVGYQRAIVHNEPGTTRDVLTAQTAIDGWPVELSDTAGVRDSDDALEQAGVARARAALQESDLVLLVCDASTPGGTAESALRAELPNALIVGNKCDLLGDAAASAVDGAILTSAISGAGLDRLLAAISQRLVPEEPPVGAGVPFTLEQITAIDDALKAACSGNAALAASRMAKWTG